MKSTRNQRQIDEKSRNSRPQSPFLLTARVCLPDVTWVQLVCTLAFTHAPAPPPPSLEKFAPLALAQIFASSALARIRPREGGGELIYETDGDARHLARLGV